MELLSPLPPAACAARIAAALAAPEATVRGQVRPDTLRLGRRIGYRNSFQPRLAGTMEPHGDGTLFRVRIGMHPGI